MSKKSRTGSTGSTGSAGGKGRPTPRRPSRNGKGRSVPTGRSSTGRRRHEPVYRQRRFPPLPWYFKAALAAFWLTALVLSFVFLDEMGLRIAVMIVATAALPLLVVFLRDPTRRTAR